MGHRALATGVLLSLLLATAGCASALKDDAVTRTRTGPTAKQMFYVRTGMAYGRAPSFDEARRWQDQMDDRVFAYLRQHPDIEQSERYSDFRFYRQVTPGNTRGEVRVLLDDPDERTIDPALMAVLAAGNWASIQPRAKEAWVYPGGWVLYFDDDAVVEITRRGQPKDS
jgi:hypothetical protein